MIILLSLLDAIKGLTKYWMLLLGIISSALILQLCIYAVGYEKKVTAEVIQTNWSAHYDVYQYQTLEDEGWYVPSGARETDSYMRRSGTKRVEDGREYDRSCECYKTTYKSVSVYDTWYEYEYDDWVTVTPLKTQGNTHDWYAPDTEDGYVWYTGGNVHIGDFRLGSLYTEFTVIFSDSIQTYTYKTDEQTWKTFKNGQHYDLVLTFFGSIKRYAPVF